SPRGGISPACAMLRPLASSPLFPYTTLFRSCNGVAGSVRRNCDGVGARGDLADGHRTFSQRAHSSWLGAAVVAQVDALVRPYVVDRKSTRLNSSHLVSSYAVFCLKKKFGLMA